MNTAKGQFFPVLPLRDIVVFPHMIVPLFVGREKSVRALEDVMADDKQILLVAQKDALLACGCRKLRRGRAGRRSVRVQRLAR